MRLHLDQPHLFEYKYEKFYNSLRDCTDQTINQSLLDELSINDDNIIFIDGEVDRLGPLKKEITNDHFDDHTLYNILNLDFKNKSVYYVTPDYNINSNLEKLSSQLNLVPLIHPYLFGFGNESRTLDGQIININNFTIELNGKPTIYEPKYNVVSLNCTKKIQRIKLIKALRGKENFIYSYHPYEDIHQLEDTFDNDEDRELLNELTELNELYEHDAFMNRSDVDIQLRSKEDIIKTFDSKWRAFQECVPLEYVQSCVDVVSESYVEDSIMLTEKTFKPIALRKPFILLSARNSHEFLQKMGFKLYDEMIDYSFDNKSFDERFDDVVKQVTWMCQMPTEQFQSLHTNRLWDKVQYNYDHLIKEQTIWHDSYELNDSKYLTFLIEKQKIFE